MTNPDQLVDENWELILKAIDEDKLDSKKLGISNQAYSFLKEFKADKTVHASPEEIAGAILALKELDRLNYPNLFMYLDTKKFWYMAVFYKS